MIEYIFNTFFTESKEEIKNESVTVKRLEKKEKPVKKTTSLSYYFNNGANLYKLAKINKEIISICNRQVIKKSHDSYLKRGV